MSQKELCEQYLKDLKHIWPGSIQYLSDIKKALSLACAAHKGQKRIVEDKPFLTHPLAVSLCVASYKDKDLVIAGLLHDVPGHCVDVHVGQIYHEFGHSVGFIVDSLTKSPLYFYGQKAVFTDKVEKFLYGSMCDVRCLVLKLADRDHNLQTIELFSGNKQVTMSFDTQAVYIPLKRILFNEHSSPISLTEIKEKLDTYLKQYSLTTPKKFKKNLFQKTFCNLSENMYHYAKKDAQSIIWQISDKEWFQKMMKDISFMKAVKILSIFSDQEGKFGVHFSFVSSFVGKIPNSDVSVLFPQKLSK